MKEIKRRGKETEVRKGKEIARRGKETEEIEREREEEKKQK